MARIVTGIYLYFSVFYAIFGMSFVHAHIMGKIKKIYKIPLFVLPAILILAAICFVTLRSPSVQTWLFERLTTRISKNNDIDISAGNIRFTFFNQIEVNNILIKDNTADTMLYSPVVKAGIRKIKVKERLISLGHVDIDSPVIKLRPDTNNVLNLTSLTKLLANEDTVKRNTDLLIRQIAIDNGELSYRSGNRPDTSETFDIHNINLSDFNLTIDNLIKHHSNIGLSISEFSFSTGKGFEMENLITEVRIEDGKYSFIDPAIKTSNSFINSELIGVDIISNGNDFNFLRDADLKLTLQSSLISLSDLGYFLEPLKGMDNDILFSGSITGTVQEMNGRDITLSYSDSTMLTCDFDLSGMPDIQNTFMFIRVESFTTTAREIAELEIPGMDKLDPGNELLKLGTISFNGNFTGFIQDFVTYGTINTELGSVSTDILFRPDTSSTFFYKGTLQARLIELGKILSRENILGSLSAHLDVEGTLKSLKNFRADIEATIDSVEFKNYIYSDIAISGLVTEKIWDGTVTSNTEDLKMDLLGRFDFTGNLPEVDFSLNLLEADLYKLNIDQSDSLSSLSMLLTASFAGNSINNMTGNIRLLNSKLRRNGDEFDLFDCSISAFNIDSSTMGINLRTDYVDADIRGKYDPASIIPDLTLAGSSLFPSLINSRANEFSSRNDFEYEIRFKNTDLINEFFQTDFLLSPGFTIKGSIKPEHKINIAAAGDYAIYKTNSLSGLDLNCTIENTGMLVDLYSEQLSLVNRLNLEKLGITSTTNTDIFNININWDNNGNLENKGIIAAEGIFSKPDSINTRLDLNLLPAQLVINDKSWQVDSSRFVIDSTSISVNRFMVNRQEEYFMIDGKISEDPYDSINISFKGLNLAGLNKLEREQTKEDSRKLEFVLEGLMNGEILLTDFYNNPMFETDVLIESFKVNDQVHGDVKILSVWDNNGKVAGISLSNNKNGINTFRVDGEYNPVGKQLDLMAAVNEMPLDILNLFLKSFASEVNGLGSGSLRIISDNGNMSLEGSVMAEQASMTIDYLQSNFRFSDSIRFNNNKIIFRNIQISDNRNNKAVVDGYVAHDNFKEWLVNLRIDADNIMALDTRQKDNSLFYGTAYASGVIAIGGPANNLDFSISAKTGRNTRMFIPLSSGEEVSDYTFISFREENEQTGKDVPVNLPFLNREKAKSISLNFELEVTPDAEVQLVFDSKLGDVMKARGTGTLNMTLDEEGDFTIFGDYVIEDGEYQLTLGNIFNKRFIVEEGGTISWNGDIMNANIDVKAIYKLKASLEDLFQDEAYAERIPVECHLNMSGQLVNPIIGFDIYLPTADESMRTDLRAAIDSEEEMSRQFLYLLVMNSFYPDPAVTGTSLNTTNAGASAMGVTTTEMLSNQLSNWLSQISNDFDIGFTYRPGNEISSQEVEVALSTQLLNDRVVINGNFDVGGETGGQTSSSTNEITGDFNVEVKITEKIRFKVFNRSNDNLVYETAPYTQGFGLFFRQSFDKFSDLFRKNKSEMKKEEEPEIIEE
ncbi:MAG: translocation/assembly module TamB [Bacteroidales bacterium]|nr:translocation/assembly module TamB [Bacteroidales bacterium]